MERVLSFSRELELLPRDGLILCALSGGGDSVALVHFLKTHGFRLAAAHFDHHLRPTSGRDADFARDFCESLDIPFYLGGARVGELSGNIEENARTARYAFLEETAAAIGASRIATAHNADDNLETVLLHLTRGCGMQGLCGIQPRRGILVRPMLHTPRAAVEVYLEQQGLSYMTDETNLDDRYARNRLRHQVVPVLESINPRVAEAFARMTGRLRVIQEDLGPWEPEEEPAPLPPLEEQAVTVGERVETPLWVLETARVPCRSDPPTPEAFYLKPTETLTVRARKTGDRIHPPFRGGKSVKKWMIELGVPRYQREAIPVLASGERVLAVAGIGPEETALARPGEMAVMVRWTRR